MRHHRTKFLVLVCHSLGEFDVLFPFFARLQSAHQVKATIVVTVQSIYEQYRASIFLQHCAKSLGINVRYIQLPNKFDHRNDKSTRTRCRRLFYHFYFFSLGVIHTLLLSPLLISSDAYLHEISNQQLTTRILYLFRKFLGTPVISYHHGAGVFMDVKVDHPIPDSESVLQLSFHNHNRATLLKLGFVKQLVIGYPQFYPEWQQLISEFLDYPTQDSTRNDYILILSRHVHPYYMDKENYIYLLTTSCAAVRQTFGNIQIRIKPHPRENIVLMRKILSEISLDNFIITWDHPSILSAHAKATITFWGSSILHSLAVGTPTIEYYIEAKRFREIEVDGSSYKKLGIHSVSEKDQLANFFEQLVKDTYEAPRVLKELNNQYDISIQKILERQ